METSTTPHRALRGLARGLVRRFMSQRTWYVTKCGLLRTRARLLHNTRRGVQPASGKLHFGCGGRRVPGWLNVDVAGSEYDIDLACGRLPWRDGVFEVVVGQQVVEHLELTEELAPLLKELRRTARPGAEIWLSCPDMEVVCRSYFEHKGADLLEDRRSRFPEFSLGGVPAQHMINVHFHQDGEHKNLFDFEILQWALEQAGFGDCRRVSEADFLERFPEFPPRNDDYSTLYVRAVAT